MTVTLPVCIYVCPMCITTLVHTLHYSLQRVLQIVCTKCKTIRINGRISLFPLPLIQLPNYMLVCFFSALQANAMKTKLHDVRLRCVSCLIYMVKCAGWATDWLLAVRHVERSVAALFSSWSDIAPLVLNLALDEDEKSAIHPGQLNSEALSRNKLGHAKAVSITYSECVCLWSLIWKVQGIWPCYVVCGRSCCITFFHIMS
jgi:hypothetical protein